MLDKFEIERPEQVVDYLGMMGDAADNIPGLPGVGDKTAKKFLKAYGSMEGLLENTHELKGKMKEKVEANKELGMLSKELAKILLDVPVTFEADSYVTQTIATGSTAVGRVINYDQTTGVLKYWQDRSVAGFNTVGTAQTLPTYGFDLKEFTDAPSTGGSITIVPSTGSNLAIDTSFTGVSTVINNRTYYLGQSFDNGVAGAEVRKHSGNIVYVDNRPSITRSSNQKEDIKVILQF